jgi:hypothetical protein
MKAGLITGPAFLFSRAGCGRDLCSSYLARAVRARCDTAFKVCRRHSSDKTCLMRDPSLLVPIFALISGFALMAQSQTDGGNTPCDLSRADVPIHCPSGWNVIEESPRETTIGNYVRSPDTPKHVFGGPGKAFLSFMTIPASYKDLAQWLFAARKTAPESVEDKLTVSNRAITTQTVTRLSAPAGPGSKYASYFFQVGRTPVLLELTYKLDDPKKEDYQSLLLAMIEGAETAK